MPVDATKYLWDARESAARIARFAQGKSLDDYLTDDDRIVWGVVTGQLARLVAELDAI
jgi:uncharacterized protein with HEPN domain